ncbi:MAG: tRNA dihydrouridine synthase DusB [Lachnospiraceae bacterium]|nr:tRNA dihydrouridine synthase DusB [Lachnospiraceae bacterium]
MTGIIKPVRIGDVTIPNNLILAPMAGVTDLPFRLLCKEQGAGLLCMEMISAKAVTYHNKKTDAMIETDPAEHPISLQIFGCEPDVMAEAARMIEDRDFDILDINMGCPVPKVVNNGEGSALMKDPGLVESIVSSVSGAIKKPVTVKIRRGFDEAHINAVEIARAAEAGGAQAIAVHGRTREQYYSGQAHWDIIADVKSAVSVPVFGNGDIKSAADVRRMYEETGCDGFMIGRACQGDPWIFKRILTGIETGTEPDRPGAEEMCKMLLRHAKAQIDYRGEHMGIREMRKHAAWYTTGYKNASKLRGMLCSVETYEELYALTKEVG